MADLNGDGRLDLVVVRPGTNTVSVLLGSGTGSFGPKTDFPTGAGPRSLAIADLNRDGKLDLVVANGGTNSVSVLLNTAPASADLAVTLAAVPDPVVVGANLTYQATVTNNGPNPAVAATLLEVLPSGVTFVSATPSHGTCSGASILTCGIGDLGIGGSANVTIVVTPTTAEALGNIVSVMGNVADFTPANDTATASVTVITAPNLAFTGEAGYTSDGVEPSSGTPSTAIIFRVKYADADGDQPYSGFPKVHILQGGNPIPGSPFVMSFVSGTHLTGAIYTFSTTLSAGSYTYRFGAADSHFLAATGPPTSSQSGPTVVPGVTLSLALGGSVAGTVTSTPAGIACPGTCTAAFLSGATITLTRGVPSGASFKAWRGACTGPAPTCTLTMDSPKTTTVVYSKVFTNDPLVSQSTSIKAVHFTELREAINTLRTYCCLPVFPWSTGAPAIGGMVVKQHLVDLRTALTEAYAQPLCKPAGLPAPTYTDPAITAGQTSIKASHLNELRTAVQKLE